MLLPTTTNGGNDCDDGCYHSGDGYGCGGYDDCGGNGESGVADVVGIGVVDCWLARKNCQTEKEYRKCSVMEGS